jgi:conjugal transfer/entry exclusion protein
MTASQAYDYLKGQIDSQQRQINILAQMVRELAQPSATSRKPKVASKKATTR